MPKYITIGYGDQAGYERTAPEIRNAAHAHDDQLKRRRALMGIAGSPVQVRNPDATGVEITNAPFMSSPLPIAGFAVIEAADLAEVIKLVSQSPCAVADGLVELWPLEGYSPELSHRIDILGDLGSLQKHPANAHKKQPIQPKIVQMRCPDAR
jgi:hypothetical protein